jgi:cell division protein FtsW (lipid II flippase)
MVIQYLLKFGNSETMNAITNYLRLTLLSIQIAEKLRLVLILVISAIAKKKQNANYSNNSQDNSTNEKENGSSANS